MGKRQALLQGWCQGQDGKWTSLVVGLGRHAEVWQMWPRVGQGVSKEEQGLGEGVGTHQAGAPETRVGAGREAGPLLIQLSLILTAWGGLPG